MKTRFFLPVAASFLVVFSACQKEDLAPAAAVPEAAAERAASIPFKATYATQPTIVAFVPPVLSLAIPSSGQGTHLGAGTWFSNSQVNVGGFPFLQTGDMLFTAADGSTLTGTFSGIAIPSITPEGHHHAEFSGDFTISGGTGRFTGYTGAGTYTGSAELTDLNPGTVGAGELEFDGTLDRP